MERRVLQWQKMLCFSLLLSGAANATKENIRSAGKQDDATGVRFVKGRWMMWQAAVTVNVLVTELSRSVLVLGCSTRMLLHRALNRSEVPQFHLCNRFSRIRHRSMRSQAKMASALFATSVATGGIEGVAKGCIGIWSTNNRTRARHCQQSDRLLPRHRFCFFQRRTLQTHGGFSGNDGVMFGRCVLRQLRPCSSCTPFSLPLQSHSMFVL